MEKKAKAKFNSCLANYYRNGNDSINWHADNERELGKNPVIASLSLGASRTFQLKHKNEPKLQYEIDLAPGSLFIMTGTTQHFWLHQIPKTKKQVGERINLTFRKLIQRASEKRTN